MLTSWLTSLLDGHVPTNAEEVVIAHSHRNGGGCLQSPTSRIVERVADRLLDLVGPKGTPSGNSATIKEEEEENAPTVREGDGDDLVREEEEELRIISLAEVGQHDDLEDAWMVIYDKVRWQGKVAIKHSCLQITVESDLL
jgi:hypothetical protein